MTIIQAKVNTRLLGKAARLFTGTLGGRVTEILQNARRAGAKHVEIINRDGVVIVRDDGRGIEDFATLLDLGGSGWAQKLEQSEDPAGVGLFCLSNRPLTVRSSGQIASIRESGWTGAAIEVRSDPQPLPVTEQGIPAGTGTLLSFPDEPWTPKVVNPLAAFTGMDVIVDGAGCPKERFITGEASIYQELGCLIKVVRDNELTAWHRLACENREQGASVLVNFHGQVTSFSFQPVTSHELKYLVDRTGAPTGLRLMLPARTRLIENEAVDQLKAALEIEAYRHLKALGRHRLPYQQFLRARKLGIDLPEADPDFQVGLLFNDMGPEPVEVTMPKGYALANCYRLGASENGSDGDEANAHLLAALGCFDEPLVPVEILRGYDGYAWANLPTIDQVEISVGKTLAESWLGGRRLICAESLSITAHCSNGKTFHSDVPMALKPTTCDPDDSWVGESDVVVTPEVRSVLSDSEIWFHLGGFDDDGDTYQTQEDEFGEQLEAFWQKLAGPHETLRSKLVACVADLKQGWRSIRIEPDGRVVIEHGDGSEQIIAPPM